VLGKVLAFAAVLAVVAGDAEDTGGADDTALDWTAKPEPLELPHAAVVSANAAAPPAKTILVSFDIRHSSSARNWSADTEWSLCGRAT
jgi:hypothetical protein